MQNIIGTAQNKFGEVVALIESPINVGGYKLIIKRDEPAKAARPYMGITAFIGDKGDVSFSWGHYDLTKSEALKWFRDYVNQAMHVNHTGSN